MMRGCITVIRLDLVVLPVCPKVFIASNCNPKWVADLNITHADSEKQQSAAIIQYVYVSTALNLKQIHFCPHCYSPGSPAMVQNG